MLLILSFPAYNKNQTNTANKEPRADETAGANVKTGVKPQPDSQVAVFETGDYGRIVIELYPNIAPQMVERFKKLIDEHFYDGTAIHRIDPDLGIIQGGDPQPKGSNTAVSGTGQLPYPYVPAGFTEIPYERWALRGPRTN